MALWLVRAGKYGEHENRFLETGRVCATWDRLDRDLASTKNRDEIREILKQAYPDASEGRIANHANQLWAFSHEIQKGDWVALPSKAKAEIHFGKVTGDYQFDPSQPNPYYHHHQVEWFAESIPRSNFDQDILYSLGAFLTICRIERNDAERRIHEMAERGWKPSSAPVSLGTGTAEGEGPVDLEQLARDQIAKLIIQKYKGHGLARLVDAILQAQGYTTHLSPEGPDKGIDIVAAPGPLGFGTPRICVQVKSSDSPVDSPTLNQLIGSMQNVQAEQGLLVSWGGFKKSVDREVATQFFRVRLWDQDDIIDQLLAHYDGLDQDDLKAELPLKRVWTVALQEEPE